jgi:hypothetical protein
LRTLQCRINDPSFDFERDRLAPALAALAARAELDALMHSARLWCVSGDDDVSE